MGKKQRFKKTKPMKMYSRDNEALKKVNKKVDKFINYRIEKFGVDITQDVGVIRDMKQFKTRQEFKEYISNKSNLKNNHRYKFMNLYNHEGKKISVVTKSEYYALKKKAEKMLKEDGFIKDHYTKDSQGNTVIDKSKSAYTYVNGKKVKAYVSNGVKIAPEHIMGYVRGLEKAQRKEDEIRDKVDIRKQILELVAKQEGIEQKKIKETQPRSVNKMNFKDLKDPEYFDVMEKDRWDLQYQRMDEEFYGKFNDVIEHMKGENVDMRIANIIKDSGLDIYDIEIIKDMFNTENDFYRAMYGSDGQKDRSEENILASMREMKEKIEWIKKVRDTKTYKKHKDLVKMLARY